MGTELPVLTRCCLCFPLRHGLIALGCVRMVISVVLTVILTKTFISILSHKENFEIHLVLCGSYLLLAVTDVVLSIVLIIAGTKKNLKLLKFYYIYSFILLILMLILGISLITYAVYLMKKHKMDLLTVWIVTCDILPFISHIILQAYMLLLVRSAFIKLRNNCEFRFVNNAADPECRMKCEEDHLTNRNEEVLVKGADGPKKLSEFIKLLGTNSNQ